MMDIAQTLRQAANHLSKLNNALSTKYHSAVMAVAVVLLVAGIGFSIYQHPNLLFDLDWKPVLVVILVCIPLTAWFNAVEFQLTGRLAGASLELRRCLEIIILASAANMLPLPGSTVVRIAGLNAAGIKTRDAATATLLVASIWVGVGFALAGAGVFLAGNEFLGGIFLFVGFIAWIAALIIGNSMKGGHRSVLMLTLVKFALVVVDIFRIYLCFQAISVSVSVYQAAGLSVAAIVGSAVSIVPAGLGVREAVSASLAPALGLLATHAFIVAALNRLLGLIVTLPLAILLAGNQNRKNIKSQQ